MNAATMTKRGKYVMFGAIGIFFIVLLPLLAILPWAASNAVAAGYYMFFTTRPLYQEIAGLYAAKFDWGTAKLSIQPDNSFQEVISVNGKQPQVVKGRWTTEVSGDDPVIDVSFKPFLNVQDDMPGRQFDYYILPFHKKKSGLIFAEINPDTGSRFEKQSQSEVPTR